MTSTHLSNQISKGSSEFFKLDKVVIYIFFEILQYRPNCLPNSLHEGNKHQSKRTATIHLTAALT